MEYSTSLKTGLLGNGFKTFYWLSHYGIMANVP